MNQVGLTASGKRIIQNGSEYSSLIAHIQNPDEAVKMFNYAISNWNTPMRDETSENLAREEERLIERGVIKMGKRVIKGFARFNPISLAAKGGLLLLIGRNLKGIADKLQYGLITESNVKSKNLDVIE